MSGNYSLAAVNLKAHYDCTIGEVPEDTGTWSAGALANPYTCAKIPVEHKWDINRFSFDTSMVTSVTMCNCHGAAIYNGGDCDDSPFYVLPFEYGHSYARGVCLPADSFGWVVSVRLICEPSGFLPCVGRPWRLLNVSDDSGSS